MDNCKLLLKKKIEGSKSRAQLGRLPLRNPNISDPYIISTSPYIPSTFLLRVITFHLQPRLDTKKRLGLEAGKALFRILFSSPWGINTKHKVDPVAAAELRDATTNKMQEDKVYSHDNCCFCIPVSHEHFQTSNCTSCCHRWFIHITWCGGSHTNTGNLWGNQVHSFVYWSCDSISINHCTTCGPQECLWVEETDVHYPSSSCEAGIRKPLAPPPTKYFVTTSFQGIIEGFKWTDLISSVHETEGWCHQVVIQGKKLLWGPSDDHAVLHQFKTVVNLRLIVAKPFQATQLAAPCISTT